MSPRCRIVRLAAVTLVTAASGLFASKAEAQSCSFTIGNANFGSFSAVAGAAVDTTSTLTATCSGSNGRTVRICPNIGSGTGGNNASASERYMLNGSNQLKYNFYQDSARATVWGSAVWPFPPLPPVIDVTLAGGSGSKSTTIYGRVLAGQTTIPPGVYSSAFSGNHTLISFQYLNTASPQSCTSIGTANGQQVPFTVSATAAATCEVQATPLNFGVASTMTSSIDSSNTISVRCSNGTPYTLGLDGGLSQASNPALRKMTNAATSDTVTYGIYRDAARLQPFGNTAGTNTISATGNGATQNYTGYGRVPPQNAVAPLDYTDTVVATVTY